MVMGTASQLKDFVQFLPDLRTRVCCCALNWFIQRMAQTRALPLMLMCKSSLFADDEAVCAAKGHFVHVYVDRVSRRPTALPAALQAVLKALAA